MLTKELLLEYFNYDSENGLLIWKTHWSKVHRTRFVGKVAGSVQVQGYIEVGFFGKSHYVHRLIWLAETGSYPKIIDHIDGNRANNKFSNLRSVTRRRNQQNLKCHRDGKLPGVCFEADRNKYRAMIKIKGKNTYLGRFKTKEEAYQKYLLASHLATESDV